MIAALGICTSAAGAGSTPVRGGAWVGPRMGYQSSVVLPAEMSEERFTRIEEYGAEVIRTPGSESNVKEIYDKVAELRTDPKNRILNQFEEFGNYRFHFHCTGTAVVELVQSLGYQVGAFVSAMGSVARSAHGSTRPDRRRSAFRCNSAAITCDAALSVASGMRRKRSPSCNSVYHLRECRLRPVFLSR